jgi:hypothetical protein
MIDPPAALFRPSVIARVLRKFPMPLDRVSIHAARPAQIGDVFGMLSRPMAVRSLKSRQTMVVRAEGRQIAFPVQKGARNTKLHSSNFLFSSGSSLFRSTV